MKAFFSCISSHVCIHRSASQSLLMVRTDSYKCSVTATLQTALDLKLEYLQVSDVAVWKEFLLV